MRYIATSNHLIQDPRVRTTATASLVKAVKAGCSLPLDVYQKLVVMLTDQFYEVRLVSSYPSSESRDRAVILR